MTPSPAADGAPRWLSGAEQETWRALLRVVVELPQALDRQLKREAGIGHVYYAILAVLAAQPDGALALRDVARATGTSLSRLSHAVDALEQRGWIARCPGADRRRQLARLTDAGARLLEEVAPGHVAEVRRLVFDRLAPEEAAQFGHLLAKLLAGLDGAR